MSIKNSRELEFAIFCIENVAAYLERDAKNCKFKFSTVFNTHSMPDS